MTDFLPQEYKMPQSESRYMKLAEGENLLRILTSPIIGWIDWKDKKPYRFRPDQRPEAPMEEGKKIKHFWAMVVWNYKEKAVQILEITQSSIQKAIKGLADDTDWGTPLGYDIRILREGEGLDTEYSTNPKPKTDLNQDIAAEFAKTYVNLEALYEGGNPFEQKT